MPETSLSSFESSEKIRLQRPAGGIGVPALEEADAVEMVDADAQVACPAPVAKRSYRFALVFDRALRQAGQMLDMKTVAAYLVHDQVEPLLEQVTQAAVLTMRAARRVSSWRRRIGDK